MAPARKLTQDEEQEVKFAFERLAGSSSTVTARHLKVALRAVGFPVKKGEVRQLLRDNGYPEDGPLAFDSFKDVMSSKMVERSPEDELKRAFALFDLGNTGKITVKDLTLIAKQLNCQLDPAEIKVSAVLSM